MRPLSSIFLTAIFTLLVLPNTGDAIENAVVVQPCYLALSNDAQERQEISREALESIAVNSDTWLDKIEFELRQLYLWSGYEGPTHLISISEDDVVQELSGTESQKLLYDDHGANTQQVRDRLNLLQQLRASRLKDRINSWAESVENSSLPEDTRKNLEQALRQIAFHTAPAPGHQYRGANTGFTGSSFGNSYSPPFLVASPNPSLKDSIQSAMSVLESIRDPEGISGDVRFQIVPPDFSLLPSPMAPYQANQLKVKRMEKLAYTMNDGFLFTNYYQGFDSVVIIGQVDSTGFPEIDEQIAELNAMGGQVGLLSVVKGRTGELEKRGITSNSIGAFFSTETGVPVAGVDLSSDYSGQSLSHEISHAKDFHKHYSQMIGEGHSEEEAYRLAQIRQLSAVEQRNGERRAMAAERTFRKKYPDSVFNKGAYAQAINYWDMGYIQSQNYPELVGIRVALGRLHKAASGQPMSPVEIADFQSKTPNQWLNLVRRWIDMILNRSQKTRSKSFQYWVDEYDRVYEELESKKYQHEKRPLRQRLQSIDDYLFYLAENNLFDLFVGSFDAGNMADQFVLKYFIPLFWERVAALEKKGLSFTQELVQLRPIPIEEPPWTLFPLFPGEAAWNSSVNDTAGAPAPNRPKANGGNGKKKEDQKEDENEKGAKTDETSEEDEEEDDIAEAELFPWLGRWIRGEL